MSRSDEQRAQDILDASDQILEVVKGGRDAWDKDRIRQLAVERLLEIIGESASSLTDGFRAQYPDQGRPRWPPRSRARGRWS